MPRNTKNSSTPVITCKTGRTTPAMPDSDGATELSENMKDSLSEEGKLIFALVMDKLDVIIGQLKVKDEKLQQVEQENIALKAKLLKLEERIDNIESAGRSTNILFSGSALSSISSDCKTSIIDMLKNKMQYKLTPEKLVDAYRLGSRPLTQCPDNRNLMVRFHDRSVRDDVLSACRRVKPSNLFANEDLIPSRSRVLYMLRQVRRKSNGKITACGSQNGRVFAFMKSPTPTARDQKIFINSMDFLDQICEKELGAPLSSLCGDIDKR